jgi:lactoylglutathione lyase
VAATPLSLFRRPFLGVLREFSMRYLHTMVRIRDIEQSQRFYRDGLGLIEIRRIENQKGRFTLILLAAHENEGRALSNKAPMIELPNAGTW